MIKSLSLFLITLIGSGCFLNLNNEVPFIEEEYPYECGPRCLQMIFKFYNVDIDFEQIVEQTNMTEEEGTSILNLTESAEANNFKTLVIKIPFKSENIDDPDLTNVPHPSIAHWQGNYFIIVEKVSNSHVNIIHPELGKQQIRKDQFIRNWANPESNKGIVILLEKT